MNCPYCSEVTKVIDKRDSGELTRRRRECLACKSRFTTFERPELSPMFIVKKDGRREKFTKEKLMTGMVRACEKRPVSTTQLQSIADEVEATLRASGREFPSRKVGLLVMSRLKK